MHALNTSCELTVHDVDENFTISSKLQSSGQ